jgi:signal peptidase II
VSSRKPDSTPSPTRPTASSAPRRPSSKTASRQDEHATGESRAALLTSGVWRLRATLFFSLAIFGAAIDLATKHIVFRWRGNSLVMDHATGPYWLIDEVFGFQTHVNEGALFGMGQGNVALFAALSVVAALAVIYWVFFAGGLKSRTLTIALGCVTAGIIGNFYDRVGLPGLTWRQPYAGHSPGDSVYAVRDWIHFKIDALNFDWPLFNIADSLLVCGAALLLLSSLFAPSGKSESGDADGAAKQDDAATDPDQDGQASAASPSHAKRPPTPEPQETK